MKKIILFFYIALFSSSVFAQAGIPFLLQGSFGSGFIFYGDTAISQKVDSANADGFSRFLIALDGVAGYAINEYFYVSFSANVTFDLFSKEQSHLQIIEYAFLGGARIYPFRKGLCVGAEFGGGSRFFSEASDNQTGSSNSNWGNSFRFSAEYDFAGGRHGVVSPVVGVWYRNLYIDSAFDNTVAVFIRVSFK